MTQKPIILLTYANNTEENLPTLDKERQEVHSVCSLDYWEAQQEATLNKEVIFQKFNTYKSRIAVFHYAGHAGKDILSLEDVDLQKETLATLLKAEIESNPESLALVFLNGCATKTIAEKIVSECGVRCVIATNRRVFDIEAKEFATQFYKTWTSKTDVTVKTAFEVAKAYILNDKNNIETRGIALDDDAHPSVWCLVEKEAGIAGKITIESITKVGKANEDIQNSLEEIKRLLPKPKTLPIAVVASTWQDYQTLPISVPMLRYGITPEEWKPYLPDKMAEAQNIAQLLQEFQEKSNITCEIVYVNRLEIQDEEWENNFSQDICPKTICIVDFFALNFYENKNFAMLFNRCPVGGFLVPVDAKLSAEQKEHATQKLNDFREIRVSWKSKFNQPYMFIDLEIPHKYLLFRRLADIAFKHLGFTTTVPDHHLSELLQQKSHKVGNSTDLG
jgi:hypothetical protein